MNETKHTPGPWETSPTASLGPQYAVYAESDGSDIAIVYDKGSALANARLIASAPDLLATCQDLVSLWDEWGSESQFIAEPLRRSLEMRVEQARAAISKAEGKD